MGNTLGDIACRSQSICWLPSRVMTPLKRSHLPNLLCQVIKSVPSNLGMSWAGNFIWPWWGMLDPSRELLGAPKVLENLATGSRRGAKGELSPRGEFFGVLSREDIFDVFLSALGFLFKGPRAERTSFLALIFSLTLRLFGKLEDLMFSQNLTKPM